MNQREDDYESREPEWSEPAVPELMQVQRPLFSGIRMNGRALHPGNLWISVHPLPIIGYGIQSDRRGHYGYTHDADPPIWVKVLMDALWELPGVTMVSIRNNQVVMHHGQLYTDAEMLEMAADTIMPTVHGRMAEAGS